MRRFTVFIVILVSAIVLSSCAKTTPPRIVSQHYNLAKIANINIEDAHVVFVNANQKNRLVIRAYNNDFPDVSVNKKTQTLNIQNDHELAVITVNKATLHNLTVKQTNKFVVNANQPMILNNLITNETNSVTINAHHKMLLNALQVDHAKNTTINAARPVKLSNLQLTNAGNASIKGPVSTNTLVVNGETILNPHQLNFNFLYQGDNVRAKYAPLNHNVVIKIAGNSDITLYGHAKVLQANLYQNAQLHARNLKVKKAYIKAHGNSFARITVRNLLFMYATKQAVIEYYGNPRVYRRVLSGSAGIPMSLRGLLAP